MSDVAEREAQRQEMLAINRAQARFYQAPVHYDQALQAQGNLAGRLWLALRLRLAELYQTTGVEATIYDLHWRWLGDLSPKRVLDLGCHAGNALSLPLAQRARAYLGIDLSRPAVEALAAQLAAHGLDHARAQAIDFLAPEFDQGDFDVVYAHSVAHHFKYFDVFLELLADRLAPGGIVVTLDPLETALPVVLARRLYRPFQVDRAWEYPFTRQSLAQIEARFDIIGLQGLMGYAKWSLPLALVSRRLAGAIGRRFHARDLATATRPGPALWRCMRLVMCWRKRP